MDITQKTQRVISCCTGLRGIERGLERAGVDVRIMCFLEIEAFICENLVCAMEQGVLAEAPIWTDLKTFDRTTFCGMVDGIIGGYPCPPFSLAGQRKGADDPRHLYPFISGIIKTTRPVWCFFENVAGHLTLGYPEVSADLRSMGYAVEAGIYSAEEVGATHQRERLFILAIRTDYSNYANSQSDRNDTGRFYTKTASASENVDNPLRDGQQPGDTIPAGRNGAIPTDQTMADTERELSQTGAERIRRKEGSNTDRRSERTARTRTRRIRTTSRGFGQLQEETGQLQEETGVGLHNRPEQPSDTERESASEGLPILADTQESRPQGGWEPQSNEQSAIERSGGTDRWPAKPGEPQYEWEEPRVESRLGFTVDGYNFREDLLRGAGNAVVEQTAEIAFIDLLQKHIDNAKK